MIDCNILNFMIQLVLHIIYKYTTQHNNICFVLNSLNLNNKYNAITSNVKMTNKAMAWALVI